MVEKAEPCSSLREEHHESTRLLSTYRVSAGGVDYWLFCADFRENATDPESVGVNAVGVAAWTASGDSAAEQALFSLCGSFDASTTTPPGIFIPQ